MENFKETIAVNKKQLVLPFAVVGMLLCTTNVSAADELARSVYVAARGAAECR